jgi:hypothetical protein
VLAVAVIAFAVALVVFRRLRLFAGVAADHGRRHIV